MSLYKVIRDCHFKNRYWNEGEIADFPKNELPNEHFESVDDERIDPRLIVEVPPEPATMSEMNELAERRKKQSKTGMAYTDPEKQEPEKKEERKGRRFAKK